MAYALYRTTFLDLVLYFYYYYYYYYYYHYYYYYYYYYFLREEDYPDIYKLFPKAEIKFIPDSRHWLVVEKPEEFAQLVTEFLKECVPDQKNPSQ